MASPRIPLPASAAVAPNDTNRPVPKIIAAVRSVAVVFPRLRLPERGDLDVVVEAFTKSFLDSAAQRYSALPRSLFAPTPQEISSWQQPSCRAPRGSPWQASAHRRSPRSA